MILILTTPIGDEHGEVVAEALKRKDASVRRLNVEQFPRQIKVKIELGQSFSGRLRDGEGPLDLERVRAVWNRRPRPSEIDPALSPAARGFALRESLTALGGLYLNLADRFWVNPPWREAGLADNKLYQLRLAHSLGLRIPRTLATNDQKAAIDFFDACGGAVIYKPLTPPVEFLPAVLWTSKVRRESLEDPRRFERSPALLQEHVLKQSDVRVNVIGRNVFAAEILSQETEHGRLDCRRELGARHRIIELPPNIVRACRRLTRRLGLAFGAIDLILTPEGEFVFLEINPAGQWLWIEQMTGQPLLDNFCEMLIQARPDYAEASRGRRVRFSDFPEASLGASQEPAAKEAL